MFEGVDDPEKKGVEWCGGREVTEPSSLCGVVLALRCVLPGPLSFHV